MADNRVYASCRSCSEKKMIMKKYGQWFVTVEDQTAFADFAVLHMTHDFYLETEDESDGQICLRVP